MKNAMQLKAIIKNLAEGTVGPAGLADKFQVTQR